MSSEQFSRINYSKYLISLNILTKGVISVFFNNTLRGGFGYFLKKTICLSGEKHCNDCVLFDACPYVYIFETHPPKDINVLKNYKSICQPFIFYTPYKYGEKIRSHSLEESLEIELTLFGKAQDLLPYFVFALKILGEEGLGTDKIKYSVEKITSMSDNLVVYQKSGGGKISRSDPLTLEIPHYFSSEKEIKIEIDLLSPMRIQKDGKILSKPCAETFLKTLLRRIYNVALFHCGVEILWDYRSIIQIFSKTRITEDRTETVWADRYSTRQKQRITMKGIIGKFYMERFPEDMTRLIRAGEILHVGKNAGFGFGKYRMKKLTGGHFA